MVVVIKLYELIISLKEIDFEDKNTINQHQEIVCPLLK